jgi:hypothetical protein
LIAGFAPLPAHAGAWIAPEGGQQIVTTVLGERNELSFVETSAYVEAPLSEHSSIVFSPWVEQNYDTEDGWRGEAVFGFKRARALGERGVAAAQASALWISHPDADCGEGGIELRGLVGRAVGQRSFVNAELATRQLDGGCGGERLDLTLGHRPSANWLVLGQVFLDDAGGPNEGVKAQVAIARFGSNGRGVQLGVRARLDGEDAEPALLISLWRRPGD